VTTICIYDGECGFCSRCVEWASHRCDVRFEPFQRTDLAAHGITENAAAAAVHCVTADGLVVRGAEAVAAVLRECRAGWPLLATAMRLPLVRNVAELAYRLVARNRHRLPGPAACAIDGPESTQPQKRQTPPTS
jgi:predicted DCC family thiol-disulfide oxidoreductase YuxK